MATKKDLVEAHAFSRRRLVTAFVSGAPGGREVEPVRPGRVLIGGVALSVLLLAGAAIAGFLLGRPPAQWLDAGSFVISKDTGEQYVVLRGGDDPVLQRVPNYVSAQLLLGDAELTPSTVRDKYIRTVQLGEDLGIEGAPAGLPSAGELVDDGWTACTGAGRRHPGRGPAARRRSRTSPGRPSWSPSEGEQWLIATAPPRRQPAGARLPLPDAGRPDLRLDHRQPARLRRHARRGRRRTGSTSSPGATRWTRTPFGVTRTRPAGALRRQRHRPLPLPHRRPAALRHRALLPARRRGARAARRRSPAWSTTSSARPAIEVAERPRRVLRRRTKYPAEWPTALPTAVPNGALCAVLHPGAGEATRPSAWRPTRPARPTRPGSRPGATTSTSSPAPAPTSCPAPTSATDAGTPYVIDTKGEKYELIGPEVPDFIGYGEVDPPLVPSTWMEFFEPGVPLSTNSARRLPDGRPARRTRKRTPADDPRTTAYDARGRRGRARCRPGVGVTGRRRPRRPVRRRRGAGLRAARRHAQPRTTWPSTGCTSSEAQELATGRGVEGRGHRQRRRAACPGIDRRRAAPVAGRRAGPSSPATARSSPA